MESIKACIVAATVIISSIILAVLFNVAIFGGVIALLLFIIDTIFGTSWFSLPIVGGLTAIVLIARMCFKGGN